MDREEIKRTNKSKTEKKVTGRWGFIRAHSDGEIVQGMGCTGALVKNDLAFRCISR